MYSTITPISHDLTGTEGVPMFCMFYQHNNDTARSTTDSPTARQ